MGHSELVTLTVGMKKLDVLLIFTFVFLSLILFTSASPAARSYAEDSDWAVRSKKPFCNAFTGCGRKRSDPAMLGPAEEEIMNLLAARIQGIRDQV